jgi:NAD(P)-dependent dehydrogenase (short-subunit alcohol dehydrogenase family)
VREFFTGLGRKTSRLKVSHAFHSPLMAPMLAEFRTVAESLTYRAPNLSWISSVTGQPIGTVDAEYWVRQVSATVRFADTVTYLRGQGVAKFLEAGPDAVLTAMTRQTLNADDSDDLVIASMLRRNRDEPRQAVSALATMHAGGAGVDWSAFFDGCGSRVDLPTYAFQHKVFWLTSPMLTGSSTSTDSPFWEVAEEQELSSLAEQLGVDESALGEVLPAISGWHKQRQQAAVTDSWRYRVHWSRLADPLATELSGNWLLPVATELRNDPRVLAVVAGLAAHGAQAVVIEMPDDADRDDLVALLRPAYGDAAGVLSLLALDGREHPAFPWHTRGELATVLLAQAVHDLHSQSAEATTRTWCLTSEAVAAENSAELVNPHQAALWGASVALGLDHPDFWAGMLDVPAVIDDSVINRLCGLLTGLSDEEQIAIRSNGIFGRRMVHASLAGRPASRSWRPRGTTLITGGTGGVSAHVARWLAASGAPHLLLTSRRGRDAAGMAELEAELSALGAKVTVAACDVTDRDSVAQLLDSVPEEYPLTAVVHAAGVAQISVEIADTTVAEYAEIGRAKIGGALHLDELLADRPLDAFIMFSSGAAVWGSAGQAAYGSANAYLDALAHRRRARGLTATAVAWGPLDTGMVNDEIREYMRRTGAPAMDPRVAIGSLQTAMDHDESHLVVGDFDWSRFAPTYTLARPRTLLDELPEVQQALSGDVAEQSGEESGLLASLAGLSEAEQTRSLLELVRNQVALVLGYDSPAAVEARRPFQDLGFDSVASVELRTALSKLVGKRLPATLVFDYANPTVLAQYLRSEVCGSGDHAGGSVTAELDRFEASLSGLSVEQLEANRVAARLQALLAKVSDTLRAPGAGEVGEKLETATAEDIFEFIDKELGLA